MMKREILHIRFNRNLNLVISPGSMSSFNIINWRGDIVKEYKNIKNIQLLSLQNIRPSSLLIELTVWNNKANLMWEITKGTLEYSDRISHEVRNTDIITITILILESECLENIRTIGLTDILIEIKECLVGTCESGDTYLSYLHFL